MNIENASKALAAVKLFFHSPYSMESIERLLPMSGFGSMSNARLIRTSPGLPPTVTFHLPDSEGAALPCRCHPAAFTTLVLAETYGESVFIDRRERGGLPYIKAGGRMGTSAGIVFSRVVAGVPEGVTVSYKNKDTLDICSSNLIVGTRNKKAERTEADVYGQLLLSAVQRAEHLFPGTPEHRLAVAKALLELALAGIHEEGKTPTSR